MNKQLFLKQLRIQLRGVPQDEVEEIIVDYTDYFSEARKIGLSEEEAAANLGSPFEIAKDIKTSRKKPSMAADSTAFDTRSFIVGAGLILFNLTIVLGPALGLIGAFFGIIFSCFVFVVSPILVAGNLLVGSGHLFELFISLVLCGIGILALPYLMNLARKGQHLVNEYIQWNMRLVRGESS